MLNNLISQAGEMDTHGIPNDFLQNIDPIALIVFIPIMDLAIYPGLRKIGIHFRPITRIFVGFMFAAAAMAFSAGIQHWIYSSPPCYDFSTCSDASTVNVGAQVPSYVLIAFSEIFASITGLEYAYTKAPPSMKSFVMSMFLLTTAFGAALGTALSSVSVDPKLVWMYIGISISAFIAGWVFWFLFKKYNKQEDQMDAMDSKDPQKTVHADEIGQHRRDVDIGTEEEAPRGEKAA
jgi:proton-dependent oligopeptide transporter, POT family